VFDKLWHCANDLGSQMEHLLDKDQLQKSEDELRALLDTTDVDLDLCRGKLLQYR
jgi:hypothetical protein